MEKSKLPFVQHFYKLCEQPKWRLKLLITIIVTILSAIFGSLAIDYNKMFENANMTDHQLDQAKLLGQVGGAVGSVFSAIIGIVITFIVILLISKIMKSDTSGKSIFSATLSYTLVTGIIGLIVIVIQWISGLSPMDYTITSLNIFDKGNKVLGAFNLQTFIGAYIFVILLYATIKLSKKTSIIFGIIYLIVFIGFSLLGASLS